MRERRDLYKIADFKDENGKVFTIFIEGINHDFLFVDFPSEKVVVSSVLYDVTADSDRTSNHIYRDKAILYVIEVENDLVTPVKQAKLGDAWNAHKYYVGLRDEPLELNNGKNVLPYCDRINTFIDVIESGKINYKEGFDKTDVYKFLERTVINDFGWMFEEKDDLKNLLNSLIYDRDIKFQEALNKNLMDNDILQDRHKYVAQAFKAVGYSDIKINGYNDVICSAPHGIYYPDISIMFKIGSDDINYIKDVIASQSGIKTLKPKLLGDIEDKIDSYSRAFKKIFDKNRDESLELEF